MARRTRVRSSIAAAAVALGTVAPVAVATPAQAAGTCTPKVHMYNDAYGRIHAAHTTYCGMWTAKLTISGYIQRSSGGMDFAQDATYWNKPAGNYSGYESMLRNSGSRYFCATTRVEWEYPSYTNQLPQSRSVTQCGQF